MKVQREACPEGNEYLSGPIANGSSLIAGRLLLVNAFSIAINNKSIKKPANQ